MPYQLKSENRPGKNVWGETDLVVLKGDDAFLTQQL
jgi:hypothetical protein